MVAHKKTLLLKRRRVLRTTLAWFYQFQATGRSRISLPRCVLVSIAECKEGAAHWTNKLKEAGHTTKTPAITIGINWFSVAGASTTREKRFFGSVSLIYQTIAVEAAQFKHYSNVYTWTYQVHLCSNQKIWTPRDPQSLVFLIEMRAQVQSSAGKLLR